MQNKKAITAILVAGSMWGFTGLFSRTLDGLGLSTDSSLITRCGFSAIVFFAYLLIRDKKSLHIKLKDIWCFVGSGILSMLFFIYTYFRAINLMSLSAAAILLYTAPAIVMLLSAVIFKEKITATKLLALVLSVLGCALVSGLGTGMQLSTSGIIYGLCAGLGYALYSIFARFALNKGYNSTTINVYSCLFCAIGAAIIFRPADFFPKVFGDGKIFLVSLAASIITCFFPYLFYTYGLTKIENGKASVMASVEPVVASLVGVIIFHEELSLIHIIGVVLVLSAIVLLNIRVKKPGN